MATKSYKGGAVEIPRGTRQYVKGREAYTSNIHESPYPKGDFRRVGWWCGYLDARTVDRLGPWFENWDGTLIDQPVV